MSLAIKTRFSRDDISALLAADPAAFGAQNAAMRRFAAGGKLAPPSEDAESRRSRKRAERMAKERKAAKKSKRKATKQSPVSGPGSDHAGKENAPEAEDGPPQPESRPQPRALRRLDRNPQLQHKEPLMPTLRISIPQLPFENTLSVALDARLTALSATVAEFNAEVDSLAAMVEELRRPDGLDTPPWDSATASYANEFIRPKRQDLAVRGLAH